MIKSKIIGNQKYHLNDQKWYGNNDNLTKAVAKKNAEEIRKKDGFCRVVKKSNGLYQLWVNAPYNLADIIRKNAKAGRYFFSKATMKAFTGTKYSTRYDPSTGITYLRVVHPKQDGIRMNNSYYRFSAKFGSLNSVSLSETPSNKFGMWE